MEPDHARGQLDRVLPSNRYIPATFGSRHSLYMPQLAYSGIVTVRFTHRAGVIRIFGAGYWRKGKVIYERENQVHE